MDALLDRLRVVRAFDISKVMSTLVAYIDGVTEGVRNRKREKKKEVMHVAKFSARDRRVHQYHATRVVPNKPVNQVARQLGTMRKAPVTYS